MAQKHAYYEIRAVDKNDGSPHVITVKDVPVDAFWSITVYNADGHLIESPQGACSFNNVTATPNKDGSITIHFGGNPKSVNYLTIEGGWHYLARMFEPRREILNGSWKFPREMLVE